MKIALLITSTNVQVINEALAELLIPPIQEDDHDNVRTSHDEYIAGTFFNGEQCVDGVTISFDDDHADDGEVIATFLEHIAQMKGTWTCGYLLIARRREEQSPMQVMAVWNDGPTASVGRTPIRKVSVD